MANFLAIYPKPNPNPTTNPNPKPNGTLNLFLTLTLLSEFQNRTHPRNIISEFDF